MTGKRFDAEAIDGFGINAVPDGLKEIIGGADDIPAGPRRAVC